MPHSHWSTIVNHFMHSRQAAPSGALTSPPGGVATLARQDQCVHLVAAAMPVYPAAAARAIVGMWRHDQGTGGHGTLRVRQLASILTDCVLAGSGGSNAVQLLCGEQAPGLLAKRPTDDMLCCAATQLLRLLKAMPSDQPAVGDHQSLEKAMHAVLNAAARADKNHDGATSATTRCAVAAAAMAVLRCGTSDQQLEEACLQSVKALLDDASYIARRDAAALAVSLFDCWVNALTIQMWISEALCIGSQAETSSQRASYRGLDDRLQRMETSVLVLGVCVCVSWG